MGNTINKPAKMSPRQTLVLGAVLAISGITAALTPAALHAACNPPGGEVCEMPTLSINGPAVVCLSALANFTAIPEDGTCTGFSYLWTGDTGTSGNLTGNTLDTTYDSCGTKTVSVTLTVEGEGDCIISASHTFDVVKVDFIKASSTVADNSPQEFEGHKTDFGDPCDPDDPGQALAVFHKDIRDEDFVVQDFDVDLHAEVLPSTVSDTDLSESWTKAAGPASGTLNKSDTFDVKYQNPKKGGLYQFEFDFGLSGCAKSGANVLLPLGGPDVTDYFLSEATRYDNWLTTMKTRVYTVSDSPFVRGSIVLSYFAKTVANMNHKSQTFEAGDSPCKTYCNNTVTICGYVFGKDHIGNFLFSHLAARTGMTLGTATFGANLVSMVTDKVPDNPDDQAAYTAGYAYGEDPSADFKDVLESKDIEAMQSEPAKRGWPSTDTASGNTYPTWGAAGPGLETTDP